MIFFFTFIYFKNGHISSLSDLHRKCIAELRGPDKKNPDPLWSLLDLGTARRTGLIIKKHIQAHRIINYILCILKSLSNTRIEM